MGVNVAGITVMGVTIVGGKLGGNCRRGNCHGVTAIEPLLTSVFLILGIKIMQNIGMK